MSSSMAALSGELKCLEMPREEAHIPGLAMEEESVLPATAGSIANRRRC